MVSIRKQSSARRVPVATVRVNQQWHNLPGNDNVVHVDFGARKGAVANKLAA